MKTLDPTADQSAPQLAPMGQPPRQPGRFTRLPAATQAIASAVLLLPTVAFYLPVARHGDTSTWALWASGPYYLAILALVARSRRRRWRALLVAALTFLTEVAVLVIAGIDNDTGTQVVIFVFICATPLAYTAAWGIARRQHPRWWKAGLPLAAILVIPPLRVLTMAHWGASGSAAALNFWLSWPGIVALGSLVCWIADIRTRNRPAHITDTAGEDIAQPPADQPHWG